MENFKANILAARNGLETLLAEYPGDSILESIQKQIDFLFRWSGAGSDKSDPKLSALTFGTEKSLHHVNDLHADLAQQLRMIAEAIKTPSAA